MFRHWRILTMAVVLCAAGGDFMAAAPPFLPSLRPETDGALKWQESLQAAHKVAIEQNKPILIVFGAEWCGFCKKLERETLSSKEIATYVNDTFVAVHLDFDKEERVRELLEVKALPCSIVVNSKAELLGRIEGYLAPAAYQEKLSTAQRQFQLVQASSQQPQVR